jgi:hypothetical protein
VLLGILLVVQYATNPVTVLDAGATSLNLSTPF